MKARTTTTESLPCNPHCEPQWPHTGDMPHLAAALQQAITGADALAKLIHADLNIRENRRMEESPECLPAPFTETVSFGLRMALLACLDEVQRIAEMLERMDMRPKRAE